MKLLTKLGLVALVGGVGTAVLYASPTTFSAAADSGDVTAALMRAQGLRDQMASDARHVQHLQQVARKEKDVIKLNCVNDKLVQIRPQLNIADRAQVELNAGQRTSLTEILQASEQIKKLREAADQCVGEPGLGDESTNSFTHPPINDPTGTDPWGNVFEPPGYASPVN